LRNLFAGEVGLSPKRFARIDRVRGVLASAGRRQWAQLANDTGYYDQAHMIAEFRAMMGVPPGAFVAGRLPAVHPC
jgi:AraC-like DNA-binding protein